MAVEQRDGHQGGAGWVVNSVSGAVVIGSVVQGRDITVQLPPRCPAGSTAGAPRCRSSWAAPTPRPSRWRSWRPPPAARGFATREQALEWLEAELPNLTEAPHAAADAGHPDMRGRFTRGRPPGGDHLLSGPLLRLVDHQSSLDIPAATLGEALADVGRRYPDAGRALRDDQGQVRDAHWVFIDGQLTQGDSSTPLTGNDHVEFLTATAGGG
ncbi:hypothetical protein [Actinomadura terrae]|uniref:hypothetical protein n=1 Tax=Actinomadura terrae TaxID=604353 RepID=UPI001FA77B08|nr:hypothetical protein [Actinomadura terrae]